MLRHSIPIAWASLWALALSFPGSAWALNQKPTIIVMSNSTAHQESTVYKNARQIVINQLTERGYVVQDGPAPQIVRDGHSPVELRIGAHVRQLTGKYTTRASIRLSASLRDRHSNRYLGQFDTPAPALRRISSTCARPCQERLLVEQVRAISDHLTARIHRRLARLSGQRRLTEGEPKLSIVSFRGIEEALLPQIEQYLRYVRGIGDVQRDQATGDTFRYRYRQAGPTQATERSLKKMLDHLQVNARLQKIGNSFVIIADPAIDPALHPRDW